MTYNIQHCRDYIKSEKENKEFIDFDLFSQEIKSQNVDVVVLKEARAKNHALHKKSDTDTGPEDRIGIIISEWK